MPAATDLTALVRDADRFLRDARLALERALLDERDVASVISGLDSRLGTLDRTFDARIKDAAGLPDGLGGPQQAQWLAQTKQQLDAQYADLCDRARRAQAHRGQVDGRIQQQYDKIVVQGLSSVRAVDVRGQSRGAIKGALRSIEDKLFQGNAVPGDYKDQLADALAGEVVNQDALDDAFFWAQDVLVQVSGYVQRRITFPAQIRAIADSTDGRAVGAPHLSGVQDGIQTHGAAARDLDQKLAQELDRARLRIGTSLSVNPRVVLDPTVRFVKSIDASYDVTITRNDVLVKLSTGFTLDRPLQPDAKLDLRAGVDVRVGSTTTLQLGYSSSVDHLYKSPSMGNQQVFIKLQIRF